MKKQEERTEKSKPIGRLRIDKNITKKKRAEEALHQSEARYRTTIMSVGDGVIATAAEGQVELLNPVAEALTGWRQEEARGKPLEEVFRIINEETRQTVENPVRRAMREGLVVGLANHSVLIAKDGTEHPIADSGAPIRDAKGEITGVVLVFRDQTQERAAQRALAESERKFRETIKYLDEGYYSCTLEGRVLDHNMAFNRILGFDLAQNLKGEKLPDFWQNPDERREYLNELMTRGSISNYLINAKKISGEKIVVMANAHLVKDEKDRLVRIDGTFTDFTERKRTEEVLKESEVKFREFFENAQVGMYRSKIDGSAFLDVNAKFSEIIGFSREELLGTPGRIRWADPEERNRMLKLLKDQEGFLSNYETRVLAKNGDVIHVLASIKLRPDEGSLDGTMVDITDRKRAEEALRESEAKHRNLVENASIGIFRTKIDGSRVLDANPKLCEILGLTREEFVGQPSAIAWAHPERREELVRLLREKGNVSNYEIDIRTKSGEIRTVLMSMTTYLELGYLEGGMQDITERKWAEEALREANNNLERSNKELEQFAYVASHDLQEPLRMVSSYTQLLAQRYEGQLDDKAKKYIDYAVDGAVRMQRLINDLLMYSRVGTRGKPLEPIDSHSVLGEVLLNLQSAVEESRAIVTNDDLPTVRADASQLVQIFQNLIANAIKFRGEFPPRIHVSAQDRGREWLFSISDTGIGIDPQHKDRLFMIFQRLHTKQEYPGTGIGLALCKRIVERHGGKIWFESEPGKGSTFFFTFPK